MVQTVFCKNFSKRRRKSEGSTYHTVRHCVEAAGNDRRVGVGRTDCVLGGVEPSSCGRIFAGSATSIADRTTGVIRGRSSSGDQKVAIIDASAGGRSTRIILSGRGGNARTFRRDWSDAGWRIVALAGPETCNQ